MGPSGRGLIFLHANGYAPDCYLPLLSALAAEHRVWAMHQRPLWEGSRPEAVDSWHPLTEDLLRFMDERGEEKVLAVGHSMGAIVTLRAAMRAPGRFEGLVLLDPVLVLKHTIVMWRLFRNLRTGHRLHARIDGASRRRRSFENLEEAFRGYRQRGVFRYMSDDALHVLIAGLIAPDSSGGYTLRYSPDWESRMYRTAVWNDSDLWAGMHRLSVPTLIVRGAESDTLTDSTCRAVKRVNASIQIVTIERTSHLVPFEQPGAVHKIIREFMRDPAAASGGGLTASTGAGEASAQHQD
jgi:pimeloyl-ACP methyl ester carboxylesterase